MDSLDLMDIGIFPNKKVKPTTMELARDFPTAIPLIVRNLKKEISQLKKHMNNMLAHRAVNYNTGFLDALEEENEKELNHLKLNLAMLTAPKKENNYFISSEDIARAKLVPISTFLKVTSNKKVNCLFHNDREASMHIYPNSYYCFSCSAHGSVIDIVMKLHNCSFTQAVRFLIGNCA